MIAMYSLVRVIGLPKRTPCQPSTTCGPETPRPHRKRPPDRCCNVIAVIAAMAGVRAGICMMPVPTNSFVVCASIQVAGVTASVPYASPVQAWENPSRSASRTRSMLSFGAAPDISTVMPSRMVQLLRIAVQGPSPWRGSRGCSPLESVYSVTSHSSNATPLKSGAGSGGIPSMT